MAIGMISSLSLVVPRAEFLGNNIIWGSWEEDKAAAGHEIVTKPFLWEL